MWSGGGGVYARFSAGLECRRYAALRLPPRYRGITPAANTNVAAAAAGFPGLLPGSGVTPAKSFYTNPLIPNEGMSGAPAVVSVAKDGQPTIQKKTERET